MSDTEKLSSNISHTRRLRQAYAFMGRPVLVVSLIYLVGLSAILRADFNYIDDMGRVARGYKLWTLYFSRYLSDFLSTFVHGDGYLTDVSPLPQLIAVVLTALSGVILLYVVTGKRAFSALELTALIPLGLSPYFLECVSYKYDAPYMALSILGGVFPLLFSSYGCLPYFTASAVGVLIVCTTYQAAVGIFPMLVAFLCMKRWNDGEQIRRLLTFLAVSIAGYGAGMVIFKYFIMQPADTYVSNSLVPIDQLLPTAAQHFQGYLNCLVGDFKQEWLVLAALLGMGYLYVMVRDSRRKKYFALPMAAFTLCVMLVLCFGFYSLLSQPLYAPRAMYGFGMYLSLLAIPIASAKKAYPAKLAHLALSWLFFVFAFTYGNALSVQKDYTEFRIQAVIQDLNDLELFTTDAVKTVELSGTIGQAPVLRNMPQDYQILNRLIPDTFSGGWMWGQYRFYHYYGIPNIQQDDSVYLSVQNMPILKDTMYHTIRGEGNYVLIELK